MPLLDRYVDGEAAYFRRKARIVEAVHDYVDRQRQTITCVNPYYNTLDQPGKGMEGMYLSVAGTSAEDGDSGQVGQGNRVNGVISLSRPSPAEAAAGKNPASHVGKVYNILSHRLASQVYQEVPGLREVYIWLSSQIGTPIDQPLVAASQLILESGVRLASVSPKVEEILNRELADIGRFNRDLARGLYPVYQPLIRISPHRQHLAPSGPVSPALDVQSGSGHPDLRHLGRRCRPLGTVDRSSPRHPDR